ncbi:MAG: hypothetical protein BWK76_10475 [Desulfobulbaceae bacterium A2]|nr:MAG: hypothetical protein BWK76_10475 [Desulfobulbaceae bacterium A2]
MTTSSQWFRQPISFRGAPTGGVLSIVDTQTPTQRENDRNRKAWLESRLESRLESALAARILLRLRRADMGKAALALDFGYKTVSGELHKQIKRLLAAQWSEMTIPDKPNSRLQKYRLTENGLLLLASLRDDVSLRPSP